MDHKTKKFKLKELISNDKKSTLYFSNLRWKEQKTCPKCEYYILYSLKPNRFGCKKCRYKFGKFTGTYLSKLKIKPSLLIHLLYLFAAGHSAYKIRDSLDCDVSTIERAFRLFRQALYDASLDQLQQLKQKSKFSKEIEIDEVILDCHNRREDKQLEYRWSNYENENLTIGVYQKNSRTVVTFPVSLNISNNILTTLRKEIDAKLEIGAKLEIDAKRWGSYYNNHGSFYKYNDYIGYGMLNLTRKRQVVAYSGIEPNGECTTFDIEDFWNYMNKWLYHYRGVPKKYFPLYLKEIEFRFNNMYKDIFYELSQLLVNSYPVCRF